MCVAAVTLVHASGCAKTEAKPKAAPPPPEVIVDLPQVTEFVPVEEFTGRLAAAESVELRARVTGYLDEVKFEEGAMVRKGDPLFVIDPRTYEAEVVRATATIGQAKAKLDRVGRQLERSQRLLASRAISSEEAELLEFDRAEAGAAVRVAEAAKALAELQLGFTTVYAPVDGRIGRRMIDPGNMVKADDTLLAHIVRLNPIHAYFVVDERTVLRLQRAMTRGGLPNISEQKLQVEFSLVDEDKASATGIIDFTDNVLDPNTGTLTARATVSNDNLMLTPGLFVRCRMPIGTQRTGLTVPEEALASDQGQRFLFVLRDDDSVQYRRVTLGPLLGGRRVIEEGLAENERIVVAGLQRIRNGQKVAPKKAAVSPSAAGAESASSDPPSKDASSSDPPTKNVTPAGK